jgi:Uma2 family endonuclease
MMPANHPSAVCDVDHVDQRVVLRDVGWDDYEAILSARGDDGGVRITYFNGELELMTPSVDHESLKKRLARLLETYAEVRNIELEGYGSWTLKEKAKRLGAEADECYLVGPISRSPKIPDIAIEVIWTSGGVDKLAVYRGLGVPEVWFWEDGTLRFFVLQDETYLAATRSHALPELDPALIVRCMAEPTQTRAIRALRTALRDTPATPDSGR